MGVVEYAEPARGQLNIEVNLHPLLFSCSDGFNRRHYGRDSKEGSPWASLWNTIVSRCGGFDSSLDLSDDLRLRQGDDGDDIDEEDDLFDEEDDDDDEGALKKKPLPCYPSTVIYGHAASRGLDIERWSKGLDSGCVRISLFLPPFTRIFEQANLVHRSTVGASPPSCSLLHRTTQLQN